MNKTLQIGILALVAIVVIMGMILYFNSRNSSEESPKEEENRKDTQEAIEEEKIKIVEDTQKPVEEKSSNEICKWVDNSDIIVKVNFTEGVVKESSYEAGFYFSPIISTMRVAREACDYRTGFSFAELKAKGAADVGVRNYSDSVRRELVGEPIDVTFDSNGAPSIGNYIEVTIAR